MSDSVSTEAAPVETSAPEAPKAPKSKRPGRPAKPAAAAPVEAPQAAEPSPMLPTVGRIVHYRREVKGKLQVLPAVVLSVANASTVNLKVMLDGPAPDLFLAGVTQGDVAGCWNWPART